MTVWKQLKSMNSTSHEHTYFQLMKLNTRQMTRARGHRSLEWISRLEENLNGILRALVMCILIRPLRLDWTPHNSHSLAWRIGSS